MNPRISELPVCIETAIGQCLNEIALSDRPAHSLIDWATDLMHRGCSDEVVETFLIETVSALTALRRMADGTNGS